jgi:catechol 2,3-dioxygenase-like lactoylglutathione lyase family enzyme
MEYVDIHHVGFWVSAGELGETVTFLTELLGLRLLSREPIGDGGAGERIFVHAGDRQTFEVLTMPETQPRPDVPVHPEGRVVGTPHICLRVRDLPAWEAKLRAAGYPITRRAPQDPGFAEWGGSRIRALWFTGPAGIGFELFEFEREVFPLPEE